MDKMASTRDTNNLIFTLSFLKQHNHSIKKVGEAIGVSPNMLYYIRSTRRISEAMCFYITEKIKELYKGEYDLMMEQYGYFFRRNYE